MRERPKPPCESTPSHRPPPCPVRPEACALWGFRQAANALGHGVLGTRASRPHLLPGASPPCGRDARVPKDAPFPRRLPAPAAPWGEIRQKAPRTDPKPWNNTVSVGVKNISTPAIYIPYQELTNSARGLARRRPAGTSAHPTAEPRVEYPMMDGRRAPRAARGGARNRGGRLRYRTGVSIASRLSSSQKSMNSPRTAAMAESAGIPTVMCSEYIGAPVCGAV